MGRASFGVADELWRMAKEYQAQAAEMGDFPEIGDEPRKNGLNSFSFTSGGMPVPLSRILISTLSPRFLVAAASVGS